MDKDNYKKTDDELVMQFFDTAKRDFADDGFSDRVMHRLPQRAKRLNRIWTTLCFAIGMAGFLLFDGIDSLRAVIVRMAADAGAFLSVGTPSSISFLPLIASIALLSLMALYDLLSTQR